MLQDMDSAGFWVVFYFFFSFIFSLPFLFVLFLFRNILQLGTLRILFQDTSLDKFRIMFRFVCVLHTLFKCVFKKI